MNSSILKALSAGFSSKQVVDFLLRKFPQHSEKIQTAISMGFSPAQILKHLSGGRKEINREIDTLTEHEKTSQQDIQRRSNVNQGAFNLGASALGAYALSRAVPTAVQALGGISSPPISPSPIQPTGPLPTTEPISPSEQQRREALKKFNEKIKKKPLVEELNDQFNQNYGSAAGEKLGSESVNPSLKSNPEIPVKVDESPKDLALTPQGDIGEIESVKNGIAKINVNGQIKHRKLSDLIKEPEEVRIAINDILQIPESERSSAMDLLHYTPQHKLLHIMFPNGKIAWYEDIDENIIDSILEAKGTPKTSGKTKTGESWSAGIPDSRFAVVSDKIIRNPKYSRDNEGKTWGYIGKQYDKFKALRIKPKIKKT